MLTRRDDLQPLEASLAVEQGTERARYRVIASLGQGGMANIFLAVMSGPARFNKLLVLKVLRDDLDANRDELVTMFLDEARLAARLQHRNLVQTYEFGEINGRYHMAMEYLEGQSLRAIQQKIAPAGLPLAEELYILAETARGLHHAHETRGFDGVPLGVVHRDVSPQNVFVTYDGEVKLLDFGIAKMAGADHLTQVGVIKGKVDYIAPEQVRGEGVDRRADVFSLGAMLWEAVTKDRFGGGLKVAEVTKFHKRLTGGEPNVRAQKPDVPEALAAIVDRALALDPGQRFATAAAFADSLERYLATLPDPPSAASLADRLAQRFAEEREKQRKRIEQQIQRIQQQDGDSGRLSSGSRAMDLSLTMSGVVDLSALGNTLSTKLGNPTTSRASTAPNRARRWVVPVIASSSLLAIAAVLGLSGERQMPSHGSLESTQLSAVTVPAAHAGQASQPMAPRPVEQRTVRINLDVSPSNARVTLDGALLPRLPFAGTFPVADTPHVFEVSAQGFQTERQLIVFDQDQELAIELRAAAAPSRAHARRPVPIPSVDVTSAAAGAPPAQIASPDIEEPTPGAELRARPRLRDFDMNDPYSE